MGVGTVFKGRKVTYFIGNIDKSSFHVQDIFFLWQNGASYSTSELSVLRNNEIHVWDRGYDDDGNQVSLSTLGPLPFNDFDFEIAVVSLLGSTKENPLSFCLLWQVWGPKDGPYEFKSAPASSTNDMFSPLSFPIQQSVEKRIEGSFVLREWSFVV